MSGGWSPACRAVSKRGSAAEDVPVQAVVLTTMPAGVIWRIRNQANGVSLFRPEPILRLSSLLMVRDAVIAGAGAALLPKLLVADDIETGRLFCRELR